MAQLEASIADLTEQFAAVPSNLELNAKIEADETAVRKEHGLLNAQTVPDTVVRIEAVHGDRYTSHVTFLMQFAHSNYMHIALHGSRRAT